MLINKSEPEFWRIFDARFVSLATTSMLLAKSAVLRSPRFASVLWTLTWVRRHRQKRRTAYWRTRGGSQLAPESGANLGHRRCTHPCVALGRRPPSVEEVRPQPTVRQARRHHTICRLSQSVKSASLSRGTLSFRSVIINCNFASARARSPRIICAACKATASNLTGVRSLHGDSENREDLA